MEKKKASTMKKLTRLVSTTSQSFLDAFINDSGELRMQKQMTADIVKKLQKAAVEKSLVVLQIQEDPHNPKAKVLSGWIATKTVGKDTVVVRDQSKEQQMHMVSIAQIKKISVLSTKSSEERMSK
ncbi:hypothetical protein IGI37_003454 [Enterococcus sp. AZ194]|uniref:hypothetical protein n=1 Tax=Enterococcus sp. AZ194 TaxID=2774629 RepID=UPI003F23392B